MHPLDRIPELAGLATYREAARVGYSVDANVARLVRLAWAERRLMETLVAHLPATPVWEVKCAMALHQWQSVEHADGLRNRIAEMRNPVPPLDSAPDEPLNAFFEELLRSEGAGELVAGVYDVAYPALAAAYTTHLAATNPLVDHPTRRILRLAVAETEDAIAWGKRASTVLEGLDAPSAQRMTAWREHLRAYLAASGGICGDDERSGRPLPAARATAPFHPDMRPQRDERFADIYNFEFPPHVVYSLPQVSAAERNLALLCKRTLEMDVPEMMASFMTERRDQPWEFYRDYSRQLWDEARHAMMGSVALDARGVDWKREVPLNVSFALRLNLHADALERQTMLYAIEQSLMPSPTGKRYEYETAVAANDSLSAHFHDYDWADEVLHARIGRSLLKREGISSDDARDRARAIHEKTWNALDLYRRPELQRDWWPDFVRRVLGVESQAPPVSTAPLGAINVFSE